ncbi:hypothetical protein DER45DRAFT_627355 [Fusarium avenaceum]|nr:hypothetical protein DER45DRAFT_627355 [Fusarium avenaceum]
MTEKDSNMTVIRVFSYEPGTKTCKNKTTLQFSVSENTNKKLEVIRKLLVKKEVFGALDARNPFCNANGAEVSDQMSIAVYLDQLADKVKDDVPADADGAAKDSADVPANSQKLDIPKFYYKKKKVQTKSDDATQEFLKKQLDMKLRENKALSPMRAQLLQSAFQADKWTAAPAAKLSVVADLGERDWSVIVRTNCLLSGQRLSYSNGPKNPCVERTPFNAFKIKGRKFDPYEIIAPMLVARIPRFRVDDSSYVTVLETHNSLQASMAKSSFNKTSIEASAGGSLWGVSAAAKAGFSTNEGTKEVTASSEKHEQVHVTYNFPRVTVFLDEHSLELTKDVKDDIKKIQETQSNEKKKELVIAFGEKYGHIFSRRVKLGGRLISSHETTSRSTEKQAQTENNLKAAAAVSVSGYGLSVSAEMSHETAIQADDSTKAQSFASNMSWEATGGNTVLCNDPPSWCGTVGNFRHWRVVEQSDIIPITKLISTFPGYGSVDEEFSELTGSNILKEDRHIYTMIQLIDIRTNKKLVGFPISDTNTFPDPKNPLQAVAAKLNHEWAYFYESGSIKLEHYSKEASHWVLEGLATKGQSAKYSYGSEVPISNKNLPEGGSYIGFGMGPINGFYGGKESGFLSPAPKPVDAPTSEGRGQFILESPPGEVRKTGPVRTGDTVVLKIANRGTPENPAYLMEGQYLGTDKEIESLIKDVPAFYRLKTDNQDNTSKILRFNVVVEQHWSKEK